MATECEDCQRVEVVVWLPRRACSFPPNWPLIGCSHNRGKGILPIGNNWCFVAGPSCPDMELMFIGSKIPPQVRKGCSLIKCCHLSCNNYRCKWRGAVFHESIPLICHCSNKNRKKVLSHKQIWWLWRGEVGFRPFRKISYYLLLTLLLTQLLTLLFTNIKHDFLILD